MSPDHEIFSEWLFFETKTAHGFCQNKKPSEQQCKLTIKLILPNLPIMRWIYQQKKRLSKAKYSKMFGLRFIVMVTIEDLGIIRHSIECLDIKINGTL